jgi:hypothetical protein
VGGVDECESADRHRDRVQQEQGREGSGTRGRAAHARDAPPGDRLPQPAADAAGVDKDVAALALYRLYCERVPSDWLARGHLALTALKASQVDEAIAEFTAIRAGAAATDDSRASVDAYLSYAYLCKEDPQQALALCEPSASCADADRPGSQQCLFYRGVSQYMLGWSGGAINDLDHLYAINPGYQGLQAVKDAMTTRTYELLLPDGAVLVPVAPGQITQSAVKVERTAPRSPHCLNCQAPLRVGALQCPYCRAAIDSAAPPSGCASTSTTTILSR